MRILLWRHGWLILSVGAFVAHAADGRAQEKSAVGAVPGQESEVSAQSLCEKGTGTSPRALFPSERSSGLPSQSPFRTGSQTTGPTQVAEVRIVGNETVTTEQILEMISTRVGNPLESALVRDSIKRPYATKWFDDIHVEEHAGPKGVTVNYRVSERPKVEEVQYIGNQKVKNRTLEEATNLRPGQPMDIGHNHAMARKIEVMYREKGYPFAKVELVEGGKKGDRRVILRIMEGPKTKVSRVAFEGNTFASSARLMTMTPFWGRNGSVGGSCPWTDQYDPERIGDGVAAIRDYYRVKGFLDVQVGRRQEWNEDRSSVAVIYRIDEGPHYKVNAVVIKGNSAFDAAELTDKLKLARGSIVDAEQLKSDLRALTDAYQCKGYVNAQIITDVNYREQPGEVDIVYRIREKGMGALGGIAVKVGP